MLDLAHLQSFAHVAERGTVAAAARALGYTPPAVSQHIAKLEDELGVALFDRAAGRLHLTEAGRSLVPVAHQITDLTHTARSVTAQPVERPHYRVAGFASAIAGIVIPRLESLADSVSLDIVEAEDTDALRELSLGSADLVLVQEYDDDPIEHDSRFAYTPIVTDHLQLVVPPDLDSGTRISDLEDSNWLINGHGTRCAQATNSILAARGIRPNVSATVSDNATLLGLVSAGHGATIVPSLVLEHVTTDVVACTEDLGVTRTVYAVTRKATQSTIQPLLHALTRTAGPVT